jgi:ribosomal protein S25
MVNLALTLFAICQAPKAAKPTQSAKPAKSSGGGKQKKKKWSKGKQKEKVSRLLTVQQEWSRVILELLVL